MYTFYTFFLRIKSKLNDHTE